MELIETTIRQEYQYRGKIVNLRIDTAQTENLAHVEREVVEHAGGVCVAVLTTENEILLVRQFRYPYGQVVLELPAGKLEPGEDPFEAAKREQREETGTTATKYVFLGDLYPTPGYVNEVIKTWACRAEHFGALRLDPNEFLEVERIPLDTAVKMVLQNELPDAKTQIGILKTAYLVEHKKL